MNVGICIGFVIIITKTANHRKTIMTQIKLLLIVALTICPGALTSASAGANNNLDRAFEVAVSEHPYIKGILVLRNGETISERYFHGASASSAHNMKSLTKSVISALVGAAINEGLIESVDQTVASILPEYFQTPELPVGYYSDFLEDRERVQTYRAQLTIKHLLTMTSGLYSFQNTFMFGFGHVDDIVGAYLGLPFATAPGEKFQYSTAAVQVLSQIIERVSGMPARQFAQQHLFDPIGVTIADWKFGPQGHVLGGTGLYLTARDLAKLGQLYLDDGVVNDQRILALHWVTDSLAEQAQVFPPAFISYGYLWWRRAGNPEAEDYFYAFGTGGQFVILMPKHKLSVIITSDPNVPPAEFNSRSEAVQGFAEEYLLSPLSASQ
jgi:CubicO group peptidase (beta-lactamase class C family)